MNEIKHVGRVKSTGKKCLVAYRTLPGEAHSCLIVPTENLPDSYHDALINLVQSTGGQDAYELAEAMARVRLPDGRVMLTGFHQTGRLFKMATKDVEMTPSINATVGLDQLNEIIAQQRGIALEDLALQSTDREAQKAAPAATVQTIEAVAELPAEPLNDADKAKQLRARATELHRQAQLLRDEAEQLVPTKKTSKA
jgi:hypothetical protein